MIGASLKPLASTINRARFWFLYSEVRLEKLKNLGHSELRRLRQIEEENRKLKQIVVDLSPDKAMLQAVVAKKV